MMGQSHDSPALHSPTALGHTQPPQHCIVLHMQINADCLLSKHLKGKHLSKSIPRAFVAKPGDNVIALQSGSHSTDPQRSLTPQ